MITSKDISGLEYDWLAVDALGFVGLFSTAGGGYAPATFLDSIAEYDAAIEAILSMSQLCACLCSRELPPGYANTWKLMAERGIYAFDSDPLGGPYQLIAAPCKPLPIHGLPQEIQKTAGRIALVSVVFRDMEGISNEEIRGAERDG